MQRKAQWEVVQSMNAPKQPVQAALRGVSSAMQRAAHAASSVRQSKAQLREVSSSPVKFAASHCRSAAPAHAPCGGGLSIPISSNHSMTCLQRERVE